MSLYDRLPVDVWFKSRLPLPLPEIRVAAEALVRDLAILKSRRPVLLSEWSQWARKSPHNTDALIRLLFRLADQTGPSIQDMVRIYQMVDRDSKGFRRLPKPIHEGGERRAPGLF